MSLQIFGWILLLAALWGPSFLFIKVAVGDIPPLTLVMGRVGIAAILLGSLWLKAHDYLGLAKTLLAVLAVPTALYGLFLLVLVFSNTRWN